MNGKVYSHRPDWGVSVGAISENGKLFFAASITNNGISNRGNFNRNRCDSFSRPIARSIISSRLDTMRVHGSTEIRFGAVLDYNDTAHNFMKKFRQSFQESVDNVLYVTTTFGNVETRERLDADFIFKSLVDLATNIASEPVSTENN